MIVIGVDAGGRQLLRRVDGDGVVGGIDVGAQLAQLVREGGNPIRFFHAQGMDAANRGAR